MKHKFLSWALSLPITPAQFKVLCAIYAEPRKNIRSKRLESVTGIARSSVKLAVTKLEAVGAITRTFRQSSSGLLLACHFKINTGSSPIIGPLNGPKSGPHNKKGEKGSSRVSPKQQKAHATKGNIVEFPR